MNDHRLRWGGVLAGCGIALTFLLARTSPRLDDSPALHTPSDVKEQAVTDPPRRPAQKAEQAPRDPILARWDRRHREADEELIAQAQAAGLDPGRAQAMREILTRQRQQRAAAVEAHLQHQITTDQLQSRVRSAKRTAEAGLQALLTPAELAALDPVGARAAVISREETK